MRERSSETPPKGALTWPSSEVPVPKGITGTRAAAQSLTTSATSAVFSANTTASGGWQLIQVSVLACCSRSARPVEKRLPKRSRSVASSLSLASRDAVSTWCEATVSMAAL